MGLSEDVKALDVGHIDEGVYLRIASDGLSVYGLDIGYLSTGALLLMELGEEEPPEEPGVLQRFYPGMPPERTFPPVPGQRVFPL